MNETTDVTKRLAAYAGGLRYEDVPALAVDRMKVSLLDSIGCAIGGSADKDIRSLYAALKEYYSNGKSILIGHPETTSLPLAILLNSMMCHVLEMDDLHKASKVHPGAVIAMGALTAASDMHCSGRQLITAMTVGYETMIRLGEAFGTVSHRKRGWHATATCGAMGMAATAGNLLGMDARTLANAFGIAGCQASGSMAFMADGSATKRFQVAKATQNGWLSATLAAAGLTGSTSVIEYADGGLLASMSDASDVSRITDGLGETFECCRVGLKLHACCGHTHQAIDAAISLRNEYGIKPEDIESVTIYTYDVSGVSWGISGKPRNSVEGQFNFPYLIAVALTDGVVSQKQFEQDRLNSDELYRLSQKVRVAVDEEYTRRYPKQWCSSVSIRLSDGTTYSREAIGARGDSSHPLPFEMAAEKFMNLTSGCLDPEQAEQICTAVMNVEALEDVHSLMAKLAR